MDRHKPLAAFSLDAFDVPVRAELGDPKGRNAILDDHIRNLKLASLPRTCAVIQAEERNPESAGILPILAVRPILRGGKEPHKRRFVPRRPAVLAMLSVLQRLQFPKRVALGNVALGVKPSEERL